MSRAKRPKAKRLSIQPKNWVGVGKTSYACMCARVLVNYRDNLHFHWHCGFNPCLPCFKL